MTAGPVDHAVVSSPSAAAVGLPEGAGAMLMIESDAGGAAAEGELARAAAACTVPARST